MLALLHLLFQFFLVICKQGMNAAVCIVTDGVDLRSKFLPRSPGVLVEQGLNPIMVFLKKRPDLILLFQSQFQIFGKTSKLLVNRLRSMDMLELPTC
jgi:hypothetical protein